MLVENDGNCAALGEHRFGAAAGTTHSVTLTLGTGVGGGIVADGRLLSGARGTGGELGHIVIERNGRSPGRAGRCVRSRCGPSSPPVPRAPRQQPAVGDDAASDAGAERQRDRVRRARRRAEPVLAECGAVAVVLDQHRRVELAPDEVA